MSIAMNLLEMAEAEIREKGCDRIERVKVLLGVLSGVMPEALDLCFQALIEFTPHKGARLEIESVPVRLRCPFCQAVFSGDGQAALLSPCPSCGEEFGHIVESGKELLLARVEAVRTGI